MCLHYSKEVKGQRSGGKFQPLKSLLSGLVLAYAETKQTRVRSKEPVSYFFGHRLVVRTDPQGTVLDRFPVKARWTHMIWSGCTRKKRKTVQMMGNTITGVISDEEAVRCWVNMYKCYVGRKDNLKCTSGKFDGIKLQFS